MKQRRASLGLLALSVALIAVGCAQATAPPERPRANGIFSDTLTERASTPVTTAATQERPRYRVTRPPASFREAVPQLAGGIDDGNVHMAFVRGDDPRTSSDWAILRITVVYDTRTFDPDEWLAAYRRVSAEDESPAAGRDAAKITVPGHGEGIIERDPQPECRGAERASLPPGRCGITVLRFSDAPGTQVVLSASGTAGETELLTLAATIERAGR